MPIGSHQVATKQEYMSAQLPPQRTRRQVSQDPIARWSSQSSRKSSAETGEAFQTLSSEPVAGRTGGPVYRSSDRSAESSSGSRPDAQEPGKFLPWLTWPFSLLLPVALLLALGTWVWVGTRSADATNLTVVGSTDGAAIAGATVILGSNTFTTSNNGEVELTLPETEQVLRVEAPGYHAVEGRISLDSARSQEIALRPNVMTGTLTDEATGAGLPNVSLRVLDANGEEVTTAVTGGDGSYRLENLPRNGIVEIDAGSYGQHSADLSEELTLDLALAI